MRQVILLVIVILTIGTATVHSISLCAHETCTCTNQSIVCENMDFIDLLPELVNNSQTIENLTLIDVDFDDDQLRPWQFSLLTNLRVLKLIDCDLETVAPFDLNQSVADLNIGLQQLSLRDNDWETLHSLSDLLEWWPTVTNVDLSYNPLDNWQVPDVQAFQQGTAHLQTLNLSHSQLSQLPELPNKLQALDLSHNEFEDLESANWQCAELETLDISHNQVKTISNQTFEGLDNLQALRLHHNQISEIHDQAFVNLRKLQELDLSHNELKAEMSVLDNTRELRYLSINHNKMYTFNLSCVKNNRELQTVDLSYNPQLHQIFGSIGDFSQTIGQFDLRNCSLFTLPRGFLTGMQDHTNLLLTGNKWFCDCQLSQWLTSQHQTRFESLLCSMPVDQTMGNISLNHLHNCSLGSSITEGSIMRHLYGSEALVPCLPYGDTALITWTRKYPLQQVGQWDLRTDQSTVHTDNGKHTVLPGGALLIHGMDKYDIDQYVCTLHSATDMNTTAQVTLRVRIDYSMWLEIELYSYLVGLLTMMVFFALYMTYTGVRKIIVKRIEEAERTSRMRKVVLAMEKYRQRQIEALHERYMKRSEQVRDNYHLQVEQLRSSYLARSERLRDYKTEKMENMTSHWDNIRDNYNGQVTRLRDYGSKHMERLWEGYERQANKVRTFGLQNRLGVMRQYKIKQRALNRLLDGLNWEATMWAKKDMELPEANLDEPLMRPRSVSESQVTVRQRQLARHSHHECYMRQLTAPFHPTQGNTPARALSLGELSVSSYHSLPQFDQQFEEFVRSIGYDDDLVLDIDEDRPGSSNIFPSALPQHSNRHRHSLNQRAPFFP